MAIFVKTRAAINAEIAKVTAEIKAFVDGITAKIKAQILIVTDKLKTQISTISGNIISQMRIWRHQAAKHISEWMNSTAGFWISIYVVAWSIAAAIVLAATGYGAILIGEVGATIAVIEQTLQALIGDLNVDLILTINDIVMSLIPEYRAVWHELYAALGGIAEELSLGVGSIANTLRNINMTISSAYMLVGFPEESAEIQFFLNSADIYEKVDANFEKYARNPQLIFDDLREWVLLPSLSEIGDFRKGVDSSIGKLNDNLQTFSENLTGFQSNVNETIDELPEEIKNVVDSHVGPFIDNINLFIDNQIIPFTEKVDEIDGILDDFIVREEDRYTKLNEYIYNDLINVLNWGNLTEDEQIIIRQQLITMLTSGEVKPIQLTNSFYNKLINDVIDLTDETGNNSYPDLKDFTVPQFISTKVRNEKTKTVSWFRGEY